MGLHTICILFDMYTHEMLPAAPDELQRLVDVTDEVTSYIGVVGQGVMQRLTGCCLDGVKLYSLASHAAQQLRISKEFGFGIEYKKGTPNIISADFSWDILPITGFDYHQISLLVPGAYGNTGWQQVNMLRPTSQDDATPISSNEISSLDYDHFEQHLQENSYVYAYEVTALTSIMSALSRLPRNDLMSLRLTS